MWLFWIIKLFYIREISASLANEVQDLTLIFFANLDVDTSLTNSELSENSLNFINKQTENYIALMKSKYGIKSHGLTRRSAEYNADYDADDYVGTYLFDGFTPLNIELSENANDIFFNQHDNASSVITLGNSADNSVTFYKQKDSKFEIVFKKYVGSADKILVHKSSLETFVITTNFRRVVIYILANDTFKQMQTLEGITLIDMIVWENTNGIFLSIIKGNNSTLNTTCVIYKWLGRHFDLVQELATHGARKISSISIGSINFLAIAKYQNDDGQTITYSEIFRYNIDTEKYEIHQNILTSGAIDMQFFSLKRGNQHETFFVVANSLEDKNHMQNEVSSIVYKYVDKYFIPFQRIPNQTDTWLPITGSDGEFLLTSLSKTEGLKLYNYDGWRFLEIKSRINDDFKHGVSSTGYQQYAGSLVIKLLDSNLDSNGIRLYKLNFIQENTFINFQEDMLDWCQKSLAETDHFDVNKFKNTMVTSPKVDIVKEYSYKVDTNAVREEYEDSEEEEMDNEDFPQDYENLKYLNSYLDQQLNEVKAIEADLDNYLQDSESLSIEDDIKVDNLILEKDAFFNGDLMTETINGDDLSSILNGLININDNHCFEDEITFDNIKVEEMIEPNYINGNELENLVLVNDTVDLKDVTINGQVILNNGLIVGEDINGIYLNSSKILLANGDQVFNDDIVLKTVKVNNGECEYLNKLDLKKIPENSLNTISNIENLNVKELFISGYLNNIEINNLNENALRTVGDQIISGNYTFESLELKGLFVDQFLLNKDPKDAILISNGEYDINKDALFSGDIHARKIHVKNRINHLKVDDGKIDALLKNTEENQHMNAYKIFEEVKLLNPINLQVKIDSNRMKNMNPFTIVPDEEITVEGDYNFTGEVTVERLLLTKDMKGSNSNQTVQDVLFKGLEIGNEELPYHFKFQQQLHVEEINVDFINDINPNDLVINGNGIVQNITGSKTIKSDVHITGSTTLVNVNNIHISHLEQNTLRTEGDQEITGKHILQELIATSVSAQTTKLGDHFWKDIVKISDNSRIYGTTIVNSSLFINTLNANVTDIEGLINNYNFTDMLRDTADFNTSEITAHKTFDRLEVDNLFVANGVNMDNVTQMLKDYQNVFRIEQDIVLPNNISIEELNVEGNLNGMKGEDFTKNWVEKTEDQLFDEEYIFETVTVYGKATILSEEINGVSLEDIFQNTIKANETFYFNDVTFRNVIMSRLPILLKGEITGLDLENIIVSSRDEQIISGSLTFANTVDVKGNLEFKGLINGLHYEKLCEFSEPDLDETKKSLIITGNAHFLNGPSLQRINNVSVTELYDDIWLKNRDITLHGHIEFEIMNFEDNVTVHGLVDDINITWLSENYFSKTKNQTVTGHLQFTDGVNFFSHVSAPKMQVAGLVSGENILEFIATAILNKVEQRFDNTLHLDTCNITDLYGDYLVNELNLPNDVMRYDVENVVTGEKRIPNVIADNLVIKQNILIQNVDMLEWIQYSLLKTGGAINGNCMFHNNVSFSQGLGVIGLVNGIKFNNKNIMMRNEEQIIIGKKTFYSYSPITFKNVNLKKTLNGVSMDKLLEDQAFKDTDNVFKSQINLKGVVKTDNVNINKLYNGTNITEVFTGLANSQDINNYFENYASLLNTSNKIKESLNYQAYFLDHYAIVQDFENLWDLYYLSFKGLSCIAEINNLKNAVTFYQWEEPKEMFRTHVGTIKLKNNITYLSILSFDMDSFLYYEYLDENNAANAVRGVLSRINSTDLILKSWPTNATKYLHTFALSDKMQKCFVITYVHKEHPVIYCQSEIGFDVLQELEIFTSSQVTTVSIGLDVYLFIISDDIANDKIYLDIWKYDKNTRLFNSHQSIFDVIAPTSISVTTYRNAQYMAIASGHLQDAVYQGFVEIYRFNSSTENFSPLQVIPIKAPIQVQFAVLPSEELILYVLTDNITEPLVIYQLEGAFGFKQKYVASSLTKMYNAKSFNTIDGKHFVLGQNSEGMTLIRSYFKGYR